MNTTKEMQLVPVEKLIPYINNARTHSDEQIKKLRSSLREFGFINPVIIDRAYNVIAGHGRILAAKAENISEVPCVFVDYLNDAQKKAYILADNRMAMDAGWDEELLKIEIESLQAEDFDLGLTGFDEKEYPIKNSSVANCIVLDPFGGSGSTLIACEQTNRICYTAELDEKYCDVIVKRYIEQVGTTENVYVVRDGQKIRFDDLGVSVDEQ